MGDILCFIPFWDSVVYYCCYQQEHLSCQVLLKAILNNGVNQCRSVRGKQMKL